MESDSESKDQTKGNGQSKSNGSGQLLIRLDAVTKVFFTDEVETHAL